MVPKPWRLLEPSRFHLCVTEPGAEADRVSLTAVSLHEPALCTLISQIWLLPVASVHVPDAWRLVAVAVTEHVGTVPEVDDVVLEEVVALALVEDEVDEAAVAVADPDVEVDVAEAGTGESVTVKFPPPLTQNGPLGPPSWYEHSLSGQSRSAHDGIAPTKGYSYVVRSWESSPVIVSQKANWVCTSGP